jgi:hypothetical protein
MYWLGLVASILTILSIITTFSGMLCLTFISWKIIIGIIRGDL